MKRRPRFVAIAVAVLCVSVAALAQRLDPRTPQTIVVGPPRGPSPTARGDSARRGRAAVLPGTPRVAWRKAFEKDTPVPPLVRDSGAVVVLTAAGELIELDAKGAERARLTLSSDAPQSASLVSDDGVVIATVGREILVVRGNAVVARRRFGDDRDAAARATSDGERGAASVLPLDDGGAVVGLDDQLLSIDGSGSIRARAPLPAPLRGSIIAVDDAVVATLATGSIVSWKPGAEVRRLGRFAGPVAGTAVRIAPGMIAGVVDAQTLMRFDIPRGAASAILSAPPGTSLGPPSVAPASIAMLAWQGGRSTVVEVDLEGRERRRVQVATNPGVDAGATPPQPPSEVLIDPEGRIAFVTPEGSAGIVDRDGTVRSLNETVCARGSRRPGTATPSGLVATPTGFLLACTNGVVLAIE